MHSTSDWDEIFSKHKKQFNEFKISLNVYRKQNKEIKSKWWPLQLHRKTAKCSLSKNHTALRWVQENFPQKDCFLFKKNDWTFCTSHKIKGWIDKVKNKKCNFVNKNTNTKNRNEFIEHKNSSYTKINERIPNMQWWFFKSSNRFDANFHAHKKNQHSKIFSGNFFSLSKWFAWNGNSF